MTHALLWWLLHVLGVDDASGSWYLFWSGFFADVTIFAAVGIWLSRHRCHESGCWRLGHPVNGIVHCRRHVRKS